MRGCLVGVVGLVLFGALISWVATDWPDTLSGLFFIGLVIVWAFVGARHRYVHRVRVDVYHHRDPRS